MTDLVAKYGRKFALAILAMGLGFAVTVAGFGLIVAVPSSGVYVAEIVGQFALVLSVSIGAFSGSSAAVEWKHGGGARSESTVTQTETVTKLEAKPAPRESGTVREPADPVDDAPRPYAGGLP